MGDERVCGAEAPPTCSVDDALLSDVAINAAQVITKHSDRQHPSNSQPGVDLLPRPPVHPDLPTLAALASSDEDRAAFAVQIRLGKASASLIRNPARQSTTIKPRNLSPSGSSPAARITAMISSTVGGSGG